MANVNKEKQYKFFIYKLTCSITGLSYIGFTTKTPEYRWTTHKYSAETSKRKTYLGKAILKYGTDCWALETLFEGIDFPRNIYILEQQYIKSHNTLSPTGYNLTLGGEGALGSARSLTQREAIRKRCIGRKASPETRAKMSASRKGMKHSEDWNRKIGEAQLGEKNHRYGKHASQETKEILSKRFSGSGNPMYGTKILGEALERHKDRAKINAEHRNWSDPAAQSLRGKLGGAKNKGRRLYTDGISRFVYTCKQQELLSFEDFLAQNPQYSPGFPKK